jgi:uncharacterized protein YneF (UPF0154 family)
MVLLGLFTSVLSIFTVVLLMLLLGFFIGSREIESGRKANHHISSLVKHG